MALRQLTTPIISGPAIPFADFFYIKLNIILVDKVAISNNLKIIDLLKESGENMYYGYPGYGSGHVGYVPSVPDKICGKKNNEKSDSFVIILVVFFVLVILAASVASSYWLLKNPYHDPKEGPPEIGLKSR